MMTDEEHKAWLEERRTVIGGHDMGALIGVHPRKTALHVWQDKVHGAEALPDNGAMRRGRILEPAILAHLEEELGRKFARPGFMRDAAMPFLGGTLDALDESDGGCVVEVKTCSFRTRHQWGDVASGDVAPAAWVQANHYAGVTGAERILIACYDVTADDLLLYQLPRDDAAIRGMREVAEAFWLEHVLLGVPPSLEHATDAAWAAVADVLDALHKRDNGQAIHAPAGLIAAAEEYARARAAAKAAEEAKRASAARIKAVLGDAAKATWDGGRVAWTTTKGRTATDWEAVARAAGASEELIAQHTAEKPGHRTLRVTLKEGED